jgi:transcriptional regulator with PAS, ATPase and Fis domain
VSCGAIPETLFEAELFGHTKGAFTGAERARVGLFAQAEGGTLFLDEIGELPLGRQAVLLRALESRAIRPVGGGVEKTFDVRVVVATNRDLSAAVLAGSFRRDLLYRINVLEIPVPPLRDRHGDVTQLVEHFVAKSGSSMRFSEAALAALDGYGWPGNVRELTHRIQRLIAIGASRIELKHLGREIRAGAQPRRPEPARRLDPEAAKAEVARALAANGGNITRAAAELGLTRHGLKKRMLRLGLRQIEASKDRKEG